MSSTSINALSGPNRLFKSPANRPASDAEKLTSIVDECESWHWTPIAPPSSPPRWAAARSGSLCRPPPIRKNDRPERSSATTSTGRPQNRVSSARCGAGKRPVPSGKESTLSAELRATRKPRLSFRFSGSFLLRYADRQFSAGLFQLPPRITRFRPNGRSPQILVTHACETSNPWYSPVERGNAPLADAAGVRVVN